MKRMAAVVLGVFLLSAASFESLAVDGRSGSLSKKKKTNAVADYEQAFKALSLLTKDERSLLTRDVKDQSPAAEALVAKLDRALSCLRRGSVKPGCDWRLNLEEKGAAAAFPHLAKVRLLAKCALFRARHNWAQGKRHDSLQDIRATIALANHVGAKGKNGFVSLMIQYEIEALALDFMIGCSTESSAAGILASVLDARRVPLGNAPKTALLRERDIIVPWVKQYVASSSRNPKKKMTRVRFLDDLVTMYGRQKMLDAVEQAWNHYTSVAEFYDLPPDAFKEKLALYIKQADIAGNPFSKIVIIECPAVKGSYELKEQLDEKWLLLERRLKP